MEQIWWERVPNALLYLSDVANNLLNEKSVVLTCSGDFPWYSHMVTSIKEAVQRKNSHKSWESISAVDDDPGKFLLNEFCKQEKRATYRPSKSIARFLAESDDTILHERFIWIKVESKERLDSWMKFVSEYLKIRGKNKALPVFILEWIGSTPVSPKKGIVICSLDDYISDYDKIVFCTLAASSVKEKTLLKTYLTELSVNLVGNDIELCAACLEHPDRFLKNPLSEITYITQNLSRNNGAEFVYIKTESEVKQLIWRAQIKSIYPLLEEYREEFVQHHYSAIEKQLPITSSYGEVYRVPNDVELGTLKYMADNGRLSLNVRENECLKFYKEARNNLAHLIPLAIEDIIRLAQ